MPSCGIGGQAGPDASGQAVSEPDRAGAAEAQADIGHLKSHPYFATTLAKSELEVRGNPHYPQVQGPFSPKADAQNALGEGPDQRSVGKLTNRLSLQVCNWTVSHSFHKKCSNRS